jgi:hypothetical protein
MSLGYLTRVTPVTGMSIVGFCVGLALTACTSTAASAPTSTLSAAPASAPSPASANAAPVDASNKTPFVIWQCNTNRPLVEPTGYVLACGDGSDSLIAVHWTSWTPDGATGTGIEHLNNCIPNCGGQAESKFVNYPVKISLTGSYLAAQTEPMSYAEITLTYLAARPLRYVKVNGKWELTRPASWSPVLPERPPSH